jgi:hypothetical protein
MKEFVASLWTRHTDNIAGSSDISSKNAFTRQPDNSDHIQRQFELVTRLGQSRIRNIPRAVLAGSFVSSVVYHRDNSVQCKSTSELLIWGEVSNNNKQFTTDAAAIVPPHNVAPSPAHSSYKTANTTDVNSVARHHYSYRPPVNTNKTSKQASQPFITDQSPTGFAPLRVPSQAHPTTQVVTHYDHCVASRTIILTHG